MTKHVRRPKKRSADVHAGRGDVAVLDHQRRSSVRMALDVRPVRRGAERECVPGDKSGPRHRSKSPDHTSRHEGGAGAGRRAVKVKPHGHTSVMASRREVPDSLDFFPTPPWATRALCELVLGLFADFDFGETCWEPAAGAGHMAEVLRDYFEKVHASDVFDYRPDYAQGAFVADRLGLVDDLARCPFKPDWIITNPPFNLAEAFLLRALGEATLGVALLVRMSWLETIERYQQIFRDTQPAKVAVFVERVPMVKGRWDPQASTATSYVWIVWEKNHKGPTQMIWIPPGQRERLTRPDDVKRFATVADPGMIPEGQ